MLRLCGSLLACVAFFARLGVALAQAPSQEAVEVVRAAACAPPPCDQPNLFIPCDDPVRQYRMGGVEIVGITVEDGQIVRPLGGAIVGPPELGVCARVGEETYLFYLPAVDEPVLRLGMLATLNAAMQARETIEIAYGMPNGALRKIEGVRFASTGDNTAAPIVCGYGDFDRCDTAFELKPDGARARDAARIVGVNLIGYGKGSRAAQIFTDNKAKPSYLIDPVAEPARFLQLMSFAFAAQIGAIPVEIVSAPALPPAEAKDKSAVPPIALDIVPAAKR